MLEHSDLDYGPALLDMISYSEYKLEDQKKYLGHPMAGSAVLHLGRDSHEDPVSCRVHQVCC